MYIVRIMLYLLVCSNLRVFSEPLTMIFAHGLADTHKQASLWQTAHPYLFYGQVIAENFPDATEQFWRINFPWTSLGQENEIAAYKKTVDSYQQDHQGEKIILAGLSRGAATVINYTALHQPQNIGALLLISPFPSMHHVTEHLIKKSWLKDIPYIQEIAPRLIPYIFWQYTNDGAHPIELITRIHPNIPILFISLEDDHLIPSDLTQILVDTCIANGHKNVHHVSLKEGRHGKPIVGKEGKRMERIIQAFFRYYNLPCDAHYARKGMKDFAVTCPHMHRLFKTP